MDEAVRGAVWLAQRSLEMRGLDGTQTSTIAVASQTAASTTTSAPAATTSPASSSTGPTSSPLLFFVALGFGVVFTNLWIIVGVKYCFRYNARNRAIRNGEEVDPIHMDNMPTRPHRRRREKKLMTMDEVNERFPLTKYKTWVATRASEGLPTAGGVNASSASRPGSVRNVDGVVPASPVETKHSVNTRPATAASASDDEATPAPAVVVPVADVESKKPETTVAEKDKPAESGNTQQSEAEQTTAAPVNKQTTVTSVDEDEDDDDHIHTAVPPELLTNPGDSCAICIDTLEEDDDIRGLTCGHAFHAGCLDPWLTSRRACCPLCKADYYTPKPRPEGEVTETDRNTRRREARMNMPQQPHSTWTGIRSHPRLLLPTRFGSVPANEQRDSSRRSARSRRQAAAAASPTTTAETPDAQQAQDSNEAPSGIAPDAATPEVVETPAQSRWRPRNPFSSVAMPRFPGRNGQDAPAEQATTEPSPSQLEAGTGNPRYRFIMS